MVLYYSATGNTEYIALEIARRLDDECINLLDRIKKQDYTPIHSEKPFIVCAPVIVCEMPRFMNNYLKKLTLTGCKNAYFVFTSGGYAGISGVLAKSIIKKKKMNYLGHAEFCMPRNYVASDHYSMQPPNEIEERYRRAYEQLASVVEDIRTGKPLTARHIWLFETIITVPFNPIWCRFMFPAKDFHTTDKCIGCGKCEKLCPLNNISLTDKKPVWGSRCTHCMACISNCPTEAIDYGNITQTKDKYTFKKYRKIMEKISTSSDHVLP